MATNAVGVVEWVCPECGSEWTTAQPDLNHHKFQCTTEGEEVGGVQHAAVR